MQKSKLLAFTLFELIVILAIVAILWQYILSPVVTLRAKRRALGVVCQNNLKQNESWGERLYMDDNKRMILFCGSNDLNTWIGMLSPYDIRESLICPLTHRPTVGSTNDKKLSATADQVRYSRPVTAILLWNGSYAINGWSVVLRPFNNDDQLAMAIASAFRGGGK